jgi:3-hydroxyisobutyrate dehydrogenase-like beta-hydroxyacid dehydrogenase
MNGPDTIAFLGFGEAARAFRESLAATDPALAFLAWDIKLDGPEAPAMRAAIEAHRVTETAGPEGLAAADWVVSAVTADQSLLAVLPLLPALGAGNQVVDINSVSPGRKRETATRVEETGARYLDMAVMAPVHPRGHRTPVLVAGGGLGGARAALDGLGFAWREAGPEPGAATAVKMVRSLFVKGLEAVTVETLLAAERSGCFEEILASLSESYPGLGWPGIATYHFERALTHGARRAAEMRESAATLDELGLQGALAVEIAEVQARMGMAGPMTGELRELVSRVVAARTGGKG